MTNLDDANGRHVVEARAEVFQVEDPGVPRTLLVDDDARRQRERRLGVVGAASVCSQRP